MNEHTVSVLGEGKSEAGKGEGNGVVMLLHMISHTSQEGLSEALKLKAVSEVLHSCKKD